MALRRQHPTVQVELADLIDHVAEQLAEAERRAGEREGPVMKFQECELELAVSLETGGQGGLKVWVLELGGGRTKTNSNTITVKFGALPGGLVFPITGTGAGPKLGSAD